MSESSSRSYVSIALSMVLVASGGCARLDEGHCIVNGGDFKCDDEDRLCATEHTSVVEPSDRGDGCVSINGTRGYFDEYFVNVKYGLPDALGSEGGPEEDLDSLTGVLTQALELRKTEDACQVEEAVMELEPCWREVKAVRTFLERPSHVRVNAARLDPFQLEVIRVFNEDIDTWLNECDEGSWMAERCSQLLMRDEG